MSIVVIGATFVDIKGFPINKFDPDGRNEGSIKTVHGGVSRNIVEDIANLELRPTFLTIVDDNAQGEEIINRLKFHKVNTQYIPKLKDGMGVWLAVFNDAGNVVSSISKRPNLMPILDIIKEHGDEIFSKCDSISIEMDLDQKIIKKVLYYAKKYNKKTYAVITNMTIACERRDLFKKIDCLVCNDEEAGILFMEDYRNKSLEEMADIALDRIQAAKISNIVVTMGEKGAIYASRKGYKGIVPAMDVNVIDTTGAGDSFFAGVCAGLTYGKTLKEACEIGTRLAGAVIQSVENVCPRYHPDEFGLKVRKKIKRSLLLFSIALFYMNH